MLAVSLAGTLLSLSLPYLSKELVDRALVGRDVATLIRIVALFGAVTVASFGANVWSGLRYTRVSAHVLFDMRVALYRHLQTLSPRFYARTRLGDIVSRLNNDIAEIQRTAAELALAWVGNLLFLIGSIAMMVWLDARLALVSLALIPPSVWVLAHYRRRLQGRVTVVRERSADIGSFLIETLLGMKLVVASNAQQREVDRFKQKNDAFIDALMAMQRTTYLSGGLPGLMLSAGGAVVFLAGGWQVINGTLTLGTFAAFLAYQMRLLGPVQGLMGLYANVAVAGASWRRVRELLDVPPDVREPSIPVALSTPALHGGPSSPGRSRAGGERSAGRVAFDRVTLAFDRGAPVLEDVSFEARPGEVVAIVGPSGSGKSTIADLLLRLLDPDSGSVRLDGVDLRDVRLGDLRGRVVLVEQEPFVFHATIAENVRYGRPEATDAEVADAARAAGLERFLGTLPRGIETVVGERGLAVSAGERQRIALARAFLARPLVLVLDEPTAALDPEVERQVAASYGALMRGRTTIVITHRLQLAAGADRVVVLDGARVVETGRADELLARASAFSRLFAEGSSAHGSRVLRTL